MPELLTRYQEGVHLLRVQSMTKAVKERAQQMFGKAVGGEIRPFGIIVGDMADVQIDITLTDNEGVLGEVANKVQAECLQIMQKYAYPGETVACWVKLTKGKYGEESGLLPKPS
ncbi:MAG: hypothetical protein ACEQSA_02355 [Weeksellaceae bacterium]